MSAYEKSIREISWKEGRPGVDPRHVEAYMRQENPCLDGLSKAEFAREVRIAIGQIDIFGIDEAEELALAGGL